MRCKPLAKAYEVFNRKPGKTMLALIENSLHKSRFLTGFVTALSAASA